MTHVRRLLLATTLTAAAAAATALGASALSSATFWQNRPHTATCGKRIKTKHFQLLCSAKGIPRPQGGGQGGDPFVELGRIGQAQIVLLTQNEFPAGSPQTLPDGTLWSRDGINCTVAQKVTCKNTKGHGFTIGNGKYRAF
jgi:hypothetical protein